MVLKEPRRSMKKNIFAFLLLLTAISAVIPQYSLAEQKASASSANIISNEISAERDYRAKVLKEYLESQNSPLAGYANDFIVQADKYNLDWRLVAAISGVESTFGEAIPTDSYNGWGWGVYGDNVIRFKSWPDGIATVSQGLRERYIDQWKAKDIYEIGSMYASSPTWASHVEYYLKKIRAFELTDTKETLSLSI